jgi:hypothetical protein
MIHPRISLPRGQKYIIDICFAVFVCCVIHLSQLESEMYIYNFVFLHLHVLLLYLTEPSQWISWLFLCLAC